MKVTLRLVMIREEGDIETLAQQEIAYCDLSDPDSAQQVMATLASAVRSVIQPLLGAEGEEDL
ncbi:MAG: hypothetical protein ACREQ7_08555 [Candidatus Binatia bacterium]